MKRRAKHGIGLALSGGAARGFAHIGVIKVLQENDIDVDYVTGTSVGSIVGALLCGGYGWQQMVDIAESLKWSELVSPTFSGMGLVSTKKLESFVGELLGEVDFDELQIPFRAVAVDISRGEEVVFSSGSVARAARASSSVPGIFEPLVEDDRALVDGGVVNNLPVALAREMGARKVIAVDLNAQRGTTEPPVNLIDVTFRSFAMLLNATSMDGREEADVLIQPDLDEFGYHDLSGSREMMARGERAAAALLKRLRRLR